MILAVAGFGRSGADFVTTLREMQGAQAEFNVLTERQIEALGRYDDKITEVSQRLNFEFKRALATTIAGMEIQTAANEQLVNSILKMIDALAGTDLATPNFFEWEKGVGQMGQAAATAAGQVEELTRRIRRANSAAGEGLADIELAVSNEPVARAKAEVAAFEKPWRRRQERANGRTRKRNRQRSAMSPGDGKGAGRSLTSLFVSPATRSIAATRHNSMLSESWIVSWSVNSRPQANARAEMMLDPTRTACCSIEQPFQDLAESILGDAL